MVTDGDYVYHGERLVMYRTVKTRYTPETNILYANHTSVTSLNKRNKKDIFLVAPINRMDK